MIVVEPSTFDIVAFDASEIVAVATEIAELLGCAEVPVTLVIDERAPMTRSSIESVGGDCADASDGTEAASGATAIARTRRALA